MTKPDYSLNMVFKKLMPFWLFLILFKFAGGLHYSILSPLGEKVFPLWFVGLLIGLSALVQVFLDVPAGYLLDKFGYKKLLKFTTLIFLIASLCLTLGLNQLTFLLTLFGGAFGWLFFGAGPTAYIAEQSSEETVGRLTSARDVFGSIGIVLSSAVIAFMLALDVPAMGLVLSIIFVAAFFAVSFAPNDTKHDKRNPISKSNFFSQAYREIVRLRPVSFIMIAAGLSSSIFYAIVWFVVPLLIAQELDNGLLGIGLGIFDFAVVALGFLLGRLVDSYDKKLLVLLGLLIFAVCGILIGFNLGILFIFLGFLATAGDELAGLSLWAWMYHIDKKHENYGLISGAIGFFEDIGWSIGPIIAGVLYGIIGPAWTISIGGFLILANLLLFLTTVRHPLPRTVPFPRYHHHKRKRHKE